MQADGPESQAGSSGRETANETGRPSGAKVAVRCFVDLYVERRFVIYSTLLVGEIHVVLANPAKACRAVERNGLKSLVALATGIKLEVGFELRHRFGKRTLGRGSPREQEHSASSTARSKDIDRTRRNQGNGSERDRSLHHHQTFGPA